jgi:hypothetical protein
MVDASQFIISYPAEGLLYAPPAGQLCGHFREIVFLRMASFILSPTCHHSMICNKRRPVSSQVGSLKAYFNRFVFLHQLNLLLVHVLRLILHFRSSSSNLVLGSTDSALRFGTAPIFGQFLFLLQSKFFASHVLLIANPFHIYRSGEIVHSVRSAKVHLLIANHFNRFIFLLQLKLSTFSLS